MGIGIGTGSASSRINITYSVLAKPSNEKLSASTLLLASELTIKRLLRHAQRHLRPPVRRGQPGTGPGSTTEDVADAVGQVREVLQIRPHVARDA